MNGNNNNNNNNNNNDKPIDYSFMRTGFNVVQEPPKEPDFSSVYDVGSLLMVFMEDALNLAQVHSNHAGRENNISSKDILNGFKVRAIYENFFWNKPDILERARENREFLIEHNDDINSLPESIVETTFYEDDSESDTESHENIQETFTKSGCGCRTCQWFWNIDEEWEKWDPQLHYQKVLKETVNQLF